jgi:hypothetical protein
MSDASEFEFERLTLELRKMEEDCLKKHPLSVIDKCGGCHYLNSVDGVCLFFDAPRPIDPKCNNFTEAYDERA